MARSVSFRAALAFALLVSIAPAAHADITAFLGATRVNRARGPGSDGSDREFRTAKGLAVGFGLVIVGFEFEWSDTSGNHNCVVESYCAPSLMTGMGNVLLQTPRGIAPVQVYGTIGAGVYREKWRLADGLDLPDRNDYGVGTNVGGGVKIDVIGPLRVRLDYRIFKLANDAYNDTPQRFYAGANLSF